MQTKYNECCRAILGMKYWNGVSTSQMLTNLKWTNLDTKFFNSKMSFIFNCIDNSAPNQFSNMFSYKNSRTSNFYIPPVRTDKGKKAFSYWGPYLWSKLPNDLKHLHIKKLKSLAKSQKLPMIY